MIKIPNLEEIVDNHNWKFLVKNILPVSISAWYSFSEAMHIVGQLMEASEEEMGNDCMLTDIMRDYCVNLMIILRTKYAEEWAKDWKNEAFLGIICYFVYRYDECFKYIKNAYTQLKDPPQSLILAYINAGSGPDHFLTQKEISELSHKAISKGITHEAALRMVALAQDEGNQKQHEYWLQQADIAEKNGAHIPAVVPNVLKDKRKEKNGYLYEE